MRRVMAGGPKIARRGSGSSSAVSLLREWTINGEELTATMLSALAPLAGRGSCALCPSLKILVGRQQAAQQIQIGGKAYRVHIVVSDGRLPRRLADRVGGAVVACQCGG